LIKEQFGKLGMYLVEKAQKEIKELNQKILFQKAEIKKKHNKDVSDSSIEIKKYFEDYDTQFFNHCLTSTFISFNDKLLNIKHKFIDDLKKEAFLKIKDHIDKHYNNYVEYLLQNIESISRFMDKPPSITFNFNPKDCSFFKEPSNVKKIQKHFKNPIRIKENNYDFIGGFSAEVEGGISYNMIFDDIIDKNTPIFEIELSKIISDIKINKIKREFEEFIEEKKMGIHLIEDYLKKYE